MKRVHVIGRKNHGKTTLVVDLVKELVRRELRVCTIKHTHHHHELDTPGKDSHRHRTAGAECVGILSPEMNAFFWPVPQPPAKHDAREQRYAAFERMAAACDLLIVEGDSETLAPKVEVWRLNVSSEPMATNDLEIRCVVTDDACDVPCPILSRSDVRALVDWILTEL